MFFWSFAVGLLKIASAGNLEGSGFLNSRENFSVVLLGAEDNLIFGYATIMGGGLLVLGFVAATGLANTLDRFLNSLNIMIFGLFLIIGAIFFA